MNKRTQIPTHFQYAIVIAMPVVVFWLFWKISMTRSVSISLVEPRVEVTYEMVWGFGLKQRVSVSAHRLQFFDASSGWIEIYDKNYNSGVSVYRTLGGETLYFGTGYKLYKYQLSSRELQTSCSKNLIPALNSFGSKLLNSRTENEIQELDPGSIDLWNYLEEGQVGSHLPKESRKSRYYKNVVYEGRFGLVRSRGKFLKVGFAPADKSAEPRFGLHFSCG